MVGWIRLGGAHMIEPILHPLVRAILVQKAPGRDGQRVEEGNGGWIGSVGAHMGEPILHPLVRAILGSGGAHIDEQTLQTFGSRHNIPYHTYIHIYRHTYRHTGIHTHLPTHIHTCKHMGMVATNP